MPPPTRKGVPAKNTIPVRFTDAELERLDLLRGPGESRSVFVRRLVERAWKDPAWAEMPPSAPATDLGDLGPLEDDPEPASAPVVALESGPVTALLRALIDLATPVGGHDRRALLVEVRRAAEDLLGER